jgi:Spy/CpxP family protein refolding chaperone
LSVRADSGEALFRPSAKEVEMRTLIAVVGLVVGVSFYVTQPSAAEEKGELKGILIEKIQDLNLTDEQENKIAEIRKDFRPRVEAAAKELGTLVKDEVEKCQGVLTPEQKTRLAADKEERREHRAECLAQHIAHLEMLDLTDAERAKCAEIRKEFQPKVAKAMEGLKGILSEDQKKAREEAVKGDKKRREVLAALKLTPDQKQKVEAVGKEVGTLVREELQKMREVLTESQREKLAEFKDEAKDRVRDWKAHRIANMRELNLTEEQKTKLMQIRQEFRPKVHEAGNKLRGLVREEVEAILAVIKG